MKETKRERERSNETKRGRERVKERGVGRQKERERSKETKRGRERVKERLDLTTDLSIRDRFSQEKNFFDGGTERGVGVERMDKERVREVLEIK